MANTVRCAVELGIKAHLSDHREHEPIASDKQLQGNEGKPAVTLYTWQFLCRAVAFGPGQELPFVYRNYSATIARLCMFMASTRSTTKVL